MTILRSFLLIVEVLCSLMLIGLILLQKSKGGGLGTAFGGGGGDGSMFGSRTGNVLTKATIVLGLIFLLNTLVLGVMFSRRAVEQSALDRELMQETSEQQSTQPAPNAETGAEAEGGLAPVTGLEGSAVGKDAEEAKPDSLPAQEKTESP